MKDPFDGTKNKKSKQGYIYVQVKYIMLKIFLTINCCIIAQLAFSQSLATNVLFDQALVVYKGTVLDIVYTGSDSEGDDFTIFTRVDQVYKNVTQADKVNIMTTKLYEYNTLTYAESKTNEFHVKEKGNYIFFISGMSESKEVQNTYFANLTNRQIEGIPFSNALETELESLRDIYMDNNQGSIAYYILERSSPVKLTGNIIRIVPVSGPYNYEVTVVSEDYSPVIIKVKDLTCICRDGTLKLNQRYLFFLIPFDNHYYLLTDRWLGIFELNASVRAHLRLQN